MGTFKDIADDLVVPFIGVEFDISRVGAGDDPKRILFVDQRLAAGTVAADVLYRAFSASDVAKGSGKNSQVHRLAEMFFKGDPLAEVWVVGVDDAPVSNKETQTVTIGNPATGDGVLVLYFAGRRVSVPVSDLDTPTQIAAAVDLALDDFDDLPFTHSAALGVITCVMRNAGLAGATLDIRANYGGLANGEELPPGVTVLVATTVPGTGIPVLTGAFAATASKKFHLTACPFSDVSSMDAWEEEHSHSSGRWAPLTKQWGHVVTGLQGILATLNAFGLTRNDPHATILGWDAYLEPIWEVIGAAVAKIHKSSKSDPARGLNTEVLEGIHAPAEGKEWTTLERNILNKAGISPLSVTEAGKVTLDRVITTFQKDAQGAPSKAWFDITTPLTVAEIATSQDLRLADAFTQFKIVSNGTPIPAGAEWVTPKGIEAELVAGYNDLQQRGLVEDAASFIALLAASRVDGNPNRVDVLYSPDLANPLYQIAMLVQHRL